MAMVDPNDDTLTGLKTTDRMVVHGLDRLLTVQRPAVLAHIRSIRRGNPDASPETIIRILERRYLTAVTMGGAAVGATAAVPAITTGVSLALSGVETAGFLEASALFAQSVTEVHGIPVEDPDRARALVMAMVLGNAGRQVITQLASQATGAGPAKTAFWGEQLGRVLPKSAVGPIADQLKKQFVKRFTVTQSGNVLGRLIPFGIGAVIGGGGNHLLGRAIVRASREAFHAAPATLPPWLEPAGIAGPRKRKKEPKSVQASASTGAAKEAKVMRAPKRRRAVEAGTTADGGWVEPAATPSAPRPAGPPALEAGPVRDGGAIVIGPVTPPQQD